MYVLLTMLLVSLCGLSLTSYAQGISEDWRLELNNDDLGIHIYSRPVKGSDVREFRGVTELNASMSELVTLLRQPQRAVEWLDQVQTVDIVESQGSYQHLLYVVNSMPWPVKSRDMYLHTYISQFSTGTVIIDMMGAPDYAEPVAEHIRMTSLYGSWRFTPEGDGVISVVYQIFADPGGSLSSWAVNNTVADVFHNTMRNLQNTFEETSYLTQGYGRAATVN